MQICVSCKKINSTITSLFLRHLVYLNIRSLKVEFPKTNIFCLYKFFEIMYGAVDIEFLNRVGHPVLPVSIKLTIWSKAARDTVLSFLKASKSVENDSMISIFWLTG